MRYLLTFYKKERSNL